MIGSFTTRARLPGLVALSLTLLGLGLLMCFA